METRTILQIVLGVIIALSLGLGGLIAYQMTREAETVVVKEVVEAEEVEEPKNPWADKGDAAIKLVRRVTVTPPLFPAEDDKKKRKKRAKKDAEEEEGPLHLEEVLENEKFVAETLKIKGKPLGWRAQWWGETKFGPSYFLVRYAFEDENIIVGPEWLVNLKDQKVVAKNLPAKVAENPKIGMESEYYDKKTQIVSAIANHRFEQGMSLAGALLLYFEQRADSDAEDTILGWTIEHEKGNLFKAYFQWIEKKEPTYAEFEFDYDRKALKAVNLQAANIMRVGEDFEKERVSIMPAMYDPNARGSNRWKGAAKKQCQKSRHRARCDALASVLSEKEVIESLEWLLTARANTPDDFEKCKEARQCAWKPEFKGENKYSVKYLYKLGAAEGKSVSWDIDLKSKKIEPTDRVARLAFRAIRPR